MHQGLTTPADGFPTAAASVPGTAEMWRRQKAAADGMEKIQKIFSEEGLK